MEAVLAFSYSNVRTRGSSCASRSHLERSTKELLDLISSERQERLLAVRSDWVELSSYVCVLMVSTHAYLFSESRFLSDRCGSDGEVEDD